MKEYFLSFDGGLTKKGPFNIDSIWTLHLSNRIPPSTLISTSTENTWKKFEDAQASLEIERHFSGPDVDFGYEITEDGVNVYTKPGSQEVITKLPIGSHIRFNNIIIHDDKKWVKIHFGNDTVGYVDGNTKTKEIDNNVAKSKFKTPYMPFFLIAILALLVFIPYKILSPGRKQNKITAAAIEVVDVKANIKSTSIVYTYETTRGNQSTFSIDYLVEVETEKNYIYVIVHDNKYDGTIKARIANHPSTIKPIRDNRYLRSVLMNG